MSGSRPVRSTAPGPDDTLIVTLVAEGLERQLRGEVVDVAAMCGERVDLCSEVAASLGLVDAIPRLSESVKRDDPLLGASLAGRYRLFGVLGAGAMGVVYRGEDLEFGRPVAVKVIRPDALPGDEAVRRFVREGEVLAALRHPSIVSVYDRGITEDGRQFLVMEWLQGESLQGLLDPQPIRTVVEWCALLADALGDAHREGVFHRDVKPSNIIVGEDGRPVLIDFGIAARNAQETLAEGTRGLGTPAYMAPEQLEPGAPARPQADVYGVCATLYHLLTGRPPYEGTPSQVIAAIQADDPPAARQLRPDLPRDLLAILDKGLERNPAARYATMAELGADLRAFLAHEPVRARYVGPIGRSLRRLRRSVAARSALASAAVLIVVSSAVLVWQASERERIERRRVAWQETWAGVEPALTLWNPSDRELLEPLRTETARRLDRAVDLAETPLPSRLVRAAFRLDHGDPAGAAEDMRVIAVDLGTDVAGELARRYRRVADGGIGDVGFAAAAVPIDELPEPATALDRYLIGFHAMRVRAPDAVQWLEDPSLDDYWPARELVLAVRNGGLPTDRADRIAAAGRIAVEVAGFEARLGASATTAHLLGGALLGQGQYREAVRAIERGLEFAPDCGALLANLGIALRRTGDLAEAERALRRAVEVRPHSASAWTTLFWVCLESRWFGREDGHDVAARVLDEMPLAERVVGRFRGELAFDRALFARRFSDGTGAPAHATAALEAWRTHGGDLLKARIALGIAEGSLPFAEVLELVAQQPDDWWALQRLAVLMPLDLGHEEVERLREVLFELTERLAPEIHLLRED
jgi:predicted Ser/Thr protein kinase/tetratricopeptide (TPR) repeat protein